MNAPNQIKRQRTTHAHIFTRPASQPSVPKRFVHGKRIEQTNEWSRIVWDSVERVKETELGEAVIEN